MRNEDLVTLYQNATDHEERRKALEALYVQNVPFIKKICSRYAWNDDIEDLMQEAYFGIVEAAGRWTQDGGATFLTYATDWIKQSIRRYLNRGGRPVKLPQHIAEMMARYQVYVRDYEARTRTKPSDFEILYQLDLTSSQLNDIRNALEMLQPRSLSAPIREDSDLSVGDMIADPVDMAETVIEEIQHEQLSKAIRTAVSELTDQEKAVLRARYKCKMSTAATGKALGITKEQARQIEAKCLKKIRSGKYRKDLEAFVEDIAHHYAFHASGVGAFRKTWTSSTEMAVLKLEELKK